MLCHSAEELQRCRYQLPVIKFSIAELRHRPPAVPLRVPLPVSDAVGPAVYFLNYLDWKNPERKRPVNDPILFPITRRLASGKWAATAGVQLRKTAELPIIRTEMEPGQAIALTTHMPHPFLVEPALPQDLSIAVDFITEPNEVITAFRRRAMRHSRRRASALLPDTMRIIHNTKDPYLKKYFLPDVPRGHDPAVGNIPHFCLWAEMMKAADCKDSNLMTDMVQGFPLLGLIHRGFEWNHLDPEPVSHHPVEELAFRAWAIRQRVNEKLLKSFSRTSERLKDELWQKSMDDVQLGTSLGPFDTEDEITNLLGTSGWTAMPRFPVEQAGKVRPVDDGSAGGSEANLFAHMTEKLAVPSIDQVISVARLLHRRLRGAPLAGWSVDEEKAFRQIAILPEDRKVAIIALCKPSTGKVSFFVMLGHPFGLTSSVFNYCRRSFALTSIVVRLFRMIAFGYYDDRFGITKAELASNEKMIVLEICTLLGVGTNDKSQEGGRIVILGIVFDFDLGKITILEKRRKAVRDEIIEALKEDKLHPGKASKLKGKLLFISGHFKARHGRAHLRALAKRQYNTTNDHHINPPLKRALVAWLQILDTVSGTRSLFTSMRPTPSDLVLFTDGSHPDQRPWLPHDPSLCRVGWVSFRRGGRGAGDKVDYSSMVVVPEIMQAWLPRQTQICMVELIAAVLAVDFWAQTFVGKHALLLVDNEAVESALIKGYSTKEDSGDLVAIFWGIVHRADLCLYQPKRWRQQRGLPRRREERRYLERYAAFPRSSRHRSLAKLTGSPSRTPLMLSLCSSRHFIILHFTYTGETWKKSTEYHAKDFYKLTKRRHKMVGGGVAGTA